MTYNGTNLPTWPCLQLIHFVSWDLSCILCRLSGIIILLISIVGSIFNVRFLLSQRYQNGLIISLFLASFLVTFISTPGVLAQLFMCSRLCSNLYCRIEGFISYFAGCLCMLVFIALSVHRYLSLSPYNRLLSCRCSTITCWFLSIALTFPLLFDYLNSYQPEGLGFHCSINWQASSKLSRLHIFISFIFLYFLPLITLLFVNIRTHFIVRNIYIKQLNSIFVQDFRYSSSMTTHQQGNDFEKANMNKYYVREATNRKHFRMHHQSLRATVFLVSVYLIAWTPYSTIAILQLLNAQFIFEHPFLITLSAVVAKLSVVLTPLVHLSITNYSSFKTIFFK